VAIITFTEAAAKLGTDPRTVAGLVSLLRVEPKRVARNGNAKGLDARDLAAIRAAVNAGRRVSSSS
jgi:hypothetical protein